MAADRPSGIDVNAVLRRQSVMEGQKSTLDSHCLEVAQLMLPRQAEFFGTGGAVGDRRTSRIIDGHSLDRLGKHSSIIENFMMPQGQIYQWLRADNDDLQKIRRVKLWFEDKTRLLFKLRYGPRSGFVTQAHESITSLGAFGNQGLWIDISKKGGFYYRSEFFGQLYWMEGDEGGVDLVHKKFRWTARQAIQKWGDRAPKCARDAYFNRPDEKHDYLHVIMPRRDADPARLDALGMPIASAHISIGDKTLIDEGGYRSLPLICSRYEKSPLEEYGRGPGMTALPEAKASQAIKRSLVRSEQLNAEPPYGMPDDGVMSRFQMKPAGVTTGAIDSIGRRLVQPLRDNADTQGGLALLQMSHGAIDDAFLYSLYELSQEVKTHVSPVAIYQRMGEKAEILSPIIGRQEAEFLAPTTAREIECMGRMGLLDDMPGELHEARGEYQIYWDSPFRRAMRAGEVAAFEQSVERAVKIAPFAPEVLKVYNFPVAIREAGEIGGMPTRWTRSEAEVEALIASDAQKLQLAEMAKAAPGVAGAVKDLSDAQATAANAGQ